MNILVKQFGEMIRKPYNTKDFKAMQIIYSKSAQIYNIISDNLNNTFLKKFYEYASINMGKCVKKKLKIKLISSCYYKNTHTSFTFIYICVPNVRNTTLKKSKT